MSNFSLLTVNNFKQQTALALGYQAVSLFLEPNYIDPASGVKTCPDAGLCASVCLSKCGRNKYTAARNARKRRTELYFDNPLAFFAQLDRDLDRLCYWAGRKGLKPAVRLNALSDLPWETICRPMFSLYPEIQFYDYTKSESRMLEFLSGNLPSNYHLTFSRSEKSSEQFCCKVLHAGGNISIVVAVDKFEAVLAEPLYELETFTAGVVNGDKHDLRFLDPQGSIVALKYKQPYRLNTGFKVGGRVAEKAQEFIDQRP